MATLQLYFLGSLGMRYGNEQLPNPPTLKSQSLLAYLVCHCSQSLHRDQLAGLFFGERTERKAHRSLSTALWHIRRCLPDDSVILNDSQTVQFDPQSPIWLDVEDFEALAARSEAASLHSAIALYRGDFLDGFYDDWIISERYRLESLYLETLARLSPFTMPVRIIRLHWRRPCACWTGMRCARKLTRQRCARTAG